MKPIVGVLVIVIVSVFAFYLYSGLQDDFALPENQASPAPASVLSPLEQEQGSIDTEIVKKESVEEDENEPENKIENQPLPDLESFKGLKEESDFISEIANDLIGGGNDDPLKDLFQ